MNNKVTLLWSGIDAWEKQPPPSEPVLHQIFLRGKKFASFLNSPTVVLRFFVLEWNEVCTLWTKPSFSYENHTKTSGPKISLILKGFWMISWINKHEVRKQTQLTIDHSGNDSKSWLLCPGDMHEVLARFQMWAIIVYGIQWVLRSKATTYSNSCLIGIIDTKSHPNKKCWLYDSLTLIRALTRPLDVNCSGTVSLRPLKGG